MPPKKFSLRLGPTQQEKRLDQVVFELLPPLLAKTTDEPLSKGKVRKLIVAGAVYLNGKRVRIASKEVFSNAKIDVYVDVVRLKSSSPPVVHFEMSKEHVLYEDDYLIAVNKPPGLPTQPTLDEARENLFSAVKKFLAKRESLVPSSVYVGLHHRLDRDTSGVILFTKLKEANAGISKIFASHQAEKTYQALVSVPQNKGVLQEWSEKNFLGRLQSQGKSNRFGAVRSGGDFAHTDFKHIKDINSPGHSFAWIEAKPRTGRTHQIRVHLSENGLPILGDETYGGLLKVGGFKVPRLMLHSADLTFMHPIHNNRVTIKSTLPKDFNECLRFIQKRGLVL